MLSPFSSLVSRAITLCFIRVQLMVAQVHGGQMKRETTAYSQSTPTGKQQTATTRTSDLPPSLICIV
ncbi:Uncharacterized protein HZ326_30974 [Fusarium oxysporum f. sp. albedinis]|nr:Uncharacterized protein HZ326_30974 [Fusarium oxysporum f. sp. albedinis]